MTDEELAAAFCDVHPHRKAISCYALRCRTEQSRAAMSAWHRIRRGRSREEMHAHRPKCPVTGATLSTAYTQLRCRCAACSEWKRGSRPPGPVKEKPPVTPMTTEEIAALWRDGRAAFLADIGYVTDIAEAAHRLVV